MSVRKRKGSSRWWYDFTIKGVRYRGPLGKARTKPQAKELEYRIKLSVYDGEEINRKNDEEEEKLMAFLEDHRTDLLPVIVMAVNTGMRRGELLKLQWSDIDFERGLIHAKARNTKNGKDRLIPMNTIVAEFLSARAEVSSGGRVFALKPESVSEAFKRIARRLGLKNLRLHDLRHTFATRLGNANTDPFTLADILGHSDLSQTKRYTHAFHENKVKAVRALERKQSRKSESTAVATSKSAGKSPVTKMAQFLPRLYERSFLIRAHG